MFNEETLSQLYNVILYENISRNWISGGWFHAYVNRVIKTKNIKSTSDVQLLFT